MSSVKNARHNLLSSILSTVNMEGDKNEVRVIYGDDLNEKKLQKAVDLSIEKYCGVMEMFRQFSELKIETHFHKKLL